MTGFSKTINTLFDLNEMMKLYPVETKRWLQNHYDNRFVWYTTKQCYLAGDEYTEMDPETNEPVTLTREADESYEVTYTSLEGIASQEGDTLLIETRNEEDVVISRSIATYQEDENSYVKLRLGLSFEDIAEILAA